MTSKFFSTLILGASLAASVHAEGTIAKRQENQQARIAQGVKSGQLTAAETARLERKEARLNREIRHDRKTGGGLSAGERAKISRQQSLLSRDIARQKHDTQTQR